MKSKEEQYEKLQDKVESINWNLDVREVKDSEGNIAKITVKPKVGGFVIAIDSREIECANYKQAKVALKAIVYTVLLTHP